MGEAKVEELLRPMTRTTAAFYIFLGVVLATIGVGLYAWYTQLTHGLIVTGMRDLTVGAPWGLYISNFVFAIAVGAAGVAIAAGVRFLKLKRYEPIARMAELTTFVAIIMALIFIVFDLGRPDRALYLFIYLFERLPFSPLAWDLTVITAYLILSLAYLYLSMREDLVFLIKRFPSRQWFYKILAVGHTPEEHRWLSGVLLAMSLAILPIMPAVHSVIAFIFGLTAARPGYYSALQGPMFVTAALGSGVAMVIIVAAVFRYVYKWNDVLKLEIFTGLANFLVPVLGIYLYLMISEQLTMRFLGPSAEVAVSDALLWGEFAYLFWMTIAIGILIPILLLVYPGNRKKLDAIVTAAVLVVVGFWIKRVLIVVPPLTVIPSLIQPLLYSSAVYVPTWVEWAIMAGIYALGVLIFAIFTKLFPIVELAETGE